MTELIEDRFWAQVRKGDGCWEWTGYKTPNGYGSFSISRKESWWAHRAAWFMTGGYIAPGMQLDHLCRNRGCVNPKHLEVVTPRENTLRGNGNASINAAKTECVNGHPFSPENTYVHPPGSPRAGRRSCRICSRAAVRRYHHRKAA